jgi:hypothetical protein
MIESPRPREHVPSLDSLDWILAGQMDEMIVGRQSRAPFYDNSHWLVCAVCASVVAQPNASISCVSTSAVIER